MKVLKLTLMLTVAVAASALAAATVPAEPQPQSRGRMRFDDGLVLRGPGSEIGVLVRDLDPATNEQPGQSGVIVERVRPGTPAETAGFRAADLVIEFDGERVRSAQQFSRLVQETPPGRQVRAAVLRDGKRTELSVTPQGGSGREIRIDGDRIQAQLDRVFENIPRITIDGQRLGMSGRIGARVQELTPELAAYFGVKDGVLVASVDADSPASRAGLRAGDVITAVNRETVTSASDLQRAVRSDTAQEFPVTIVRDKKESSLTLRVEPPVRQRLERPARPLRPVRGAEL